MRKRFVLSIRQTSTISTSTKVETWLIPELSSFYLMLAMKKNRYLVLVAFELLWGRATVDALLHNNSKSSASLRGSASFGASGKRNGAVVTSTSTAPVIGILSQPLSSNVESDDYIAASYAKWLEAGGARSIPIPYDADEHLVEDLFQQINGLLLPGGGSEMPPAVTFLMDKIVKSNTDGLYFPVWGTCLGFEFLLQYAGGPTFLESGFDSENVSLPLYEVEPRELYADPIVYLTVTQRNVTMNNHQLGVSPDRFRDNNLASQLWDITSINTDSNGQPFVSTIEPHHPDIFPIYGVQYHPEKNAFEYSTYPGTNIPYEAIDHSSEGLDFSIRMARFFVAKARRSLDSKGNSHFYTKSDVYPSIYTYPVRTGLKFEQIYVIPKASHWKLSTGFDHANVL